MKKLFRTLRTYSPEEKLFSALLAGIFLFSISQIILGEKGLTDPDNYTEGIIGQAAVINPLFVDFNEADREISRLIFSGLAKYDSAEKSVVEDMATLKLSENQKEYTFTLKEAAMWHDGEPVTASDVFFTFHTVIQDPNFTNPILKANFEGVEIDKLDEKTVKFTLKKPNSFFITNFTIGLLPKHIFEKVPIEEIQTSDKNKKPIGTGPFEVEVGYTLTSNGIGEIKLKRFKEHYAGPARLKHFTIKTYPNATIMAKHKKELNGMAGIVGKEIELFANDNRFELIPYQLPQYNALFLNLESPLLKSKKLRIALQKGIDREKLLKILPNRKSINTPLMALDQEEWVFQSNSTEAQGALFDAGWKLEELEDGTKIRKNKNNEELRLKMVTLKFPQASRKEEETEKIIEFLENSWGEIGIQLDVKSLSPDAISEMIQHRDYDIFLAGQSFGYNLDTYDFWHSASTTAEGLNLSNYKSFAVDALIEDIRLTFDDDRKEDRLKKLATQIKEDIPAIFLFRDVYSYVSDKKIPQIKVSGLAFPSDRFSNIHEWTGRKQE